MNTHLYQRRDIPLGYKLNGIRGEAFITDKEVDELYDKCGADKATKYMQMLFAQVDVLLIDKDQENII